MKQDKFLTGILIGIAALVILALAAFFLRQNSQQYGPEDSPSGVLHNYLVALRKGDYERGYSYLADLDYKPTAARFRLAFENGTINPNTVGVEVLKESISGDEAFVTLSLVYGASDPFSSVSRNQETASFVRQRGQWKLSQLSYQFWAYDWYQKP